ncbi:MAG TPA: hypothetical protein VE959_07720 [Bryobacteraceae bacterium]|nr:hypothetical protein [Bryobacteraceae bacterium]
MGRQGECFLKSSGPGMMVCEKRKRVAALSRALDMLRRLIGLRKQARGRQRVNGVHRGHAPSAWSSH